MGDPQGCRVSVDPVRDHAVVHGLPCRDLITGQQTHDTRVPMVELRQHTREVAVALHRPPGGCRPDCGSEHRPQEVLEGLTDGMALKRWVMKEAPC